MPLEYSLGPLGALLVEAPDRYAPLRAQHPEEPRRRTILRIAHEFWVLPQANKTALSQGPQGHLTTGPWVDDPDANDAVVREPGLGIVVRTDYADDDAWRAFLAKLGEAEREYASAPSPIEGESMEVEPNEGQESEAMDADSDSSDSEADAQAGSAAPIFSIVDGPRAALEGISNLAALRLFNDVRVRPAPTPPPGASRIAPHRLIAQDGWQEVYAGKALWVYDTRSNADHTVRVVSQSSADSTYGTATGDSWRARVSHICELQVNMAVSGMTIDFNGLDRWDYNERKRNMDEAAVV